MKRVLPVIAAVGALAMAIPAIAQTSADINARQAVLDARINQGLQDRSLSPAEAATLRAQFNEIANIEVRYRDTDGLSPNEVIDLDRRLGSLETQLRAQRTQYNPGYTPDRGGWQQIDQRQQMLDNRIDQGVRSGGLTAEEALRLRAEYRDIANLEARYRADGALGASERAELDRRFDLLSARIQTERADNDRYAPRGPLPPVAAPWQSINMRQAVLNRRIDQGVRDGTLSRGEAMRLRAEFQQIARLEARYRTTGGGLQGWERADLDQRFDRLSSEIRLERADRQYDRGYDRGVGANAGYRR